MTTETAAANALADEIARLRGELEQVQADNAALSGAITHYTTAPELEERLRGWDVLCRLGQESHPGAALLKLQASQAEQLSAAVAQIHKLLAACEQTEADYAMLRGVVRLCFGENATDEHMLDLWKLVTTDNHPGVAINIRFNKMKAERDGVLAGVRRAASHLPGNPDAAAAVLSQLLGEG